MAAIRILDFYYLGVKSMVFGRVESISRGLKNGFNHHQDPKTKMAPNPDKNTKHTQFLMNLSVILNTVLR